MVGVDEFEGHSERLKNRLEGQGTLPGEVGKVTRAQNRKVLQINWLRSQSNLANLLKKLARLLFGSRVRLLAPTALPVLTIGTSLPIACSPPSVSRQAIDDDSRRRE